MLSAAALSLLTRALDAASPLTASPLTAFVRAPRLGGVRRDPRAGKRLSAAPATIDTADRPLTPATRVWVLVECAQPRDGQCASARGGSGGKAATYAEREPGTPSSTQRRSGGKRLGRGQGAPARLSRELGLSRRTRRVHLLDDAPQSQRQCARRWTCRPVCKSWEEGAVSLLSRAIARFWAWSGTEKRNCADSF